MAFGIHFDAILDHVSFVNGTVAMSNAVRKMATLVEKTGGDIQQTFNKLLDGGQAEAFSRRAQTISDTFKNIVSNMGLAGDAATQATDKIDKAMENFANSPERAKKRFKDFAKEIAIIFDDIKTKEAPVGNADSTSAISSLERRLDLEESILDVLKAQREEAVKQRNTKADDVNVKQSELSNLKSSLDSKYHAAAVGVYDDEDAAMLDSSEEALARSRQAWEESNAQVQIYDQLIAEATSKTQSMSGRVDELKNVYMGFANTAESASTKIFISEEVFNRYKQLIGRIEELKDEISSIPDTDVDLPKLQGLQAELASAQEEFRSLDGAARHTAEILGSDLAQKTSKALEELYKWNGLVRSASEDVNTLEQKLKDAKKELAEAKDPAAITAAKKRVDELSVSLDGANDKLSKFKAEQKDVVSEIQRLSNQVKNAGTERGNGVDVAKEVDAQVKSIMGNIAAIAGIGLGLGELKDFFNKAKEWRMYFQDIESSFKVFLGSAEKGTEFTEKLQKYAYYNMFEFSDLAAASQQMISYGHDVESVIPRLDQLSNVATGTHGSLMELVDAYNRAKATGVVDARGVQSWAVKGVMIRDVLRDMGETVAGTTITFDQLNKVLDHVTGEGGQFHNLMGEMMNNVSAEAGQLEDNLSLMFNEIGTQYEDVFVRFLKLQGEIANSYRDVGGGLLDFGVEAATFALDKLAKNWRTIVDVIKGAMVAYGTFKTVMIAHNAYMAVHEKFVKLATLGYEMNTAGVTKNTIAKGLNKAASNAGAAANAKETATKTAETGAEIANTGAKGANTTATLTLRNAMAGLNATILANPWVLAAAALAGLAYACYNAYDGIMTQEKAQNMLTRATEDYSATLKEEEQAARESIGIIQNKTATLMQQTRAYRDLIAEHDIFSQFSKEEIGNMGSEQIQNLLNEEKAKKEEEYLRNMVAAAEELQTKFAGKGPAAFFSQDKEIDEVVKKYKLLPEYAEELKNSINAGTILSNWAIGIKEGADTKLHEYLAKEAETGIVEGIKKGMSNDAMKSDVVKLLFDYGNKISEKTAEEEKKLAEARARKSDIESGKITFNSESERINAVNEINKQIETLNIDLIKTRGEVGKTFEKSFAEKAREAKKEVDSLQHSLALATGEKKAELQVKLTEAQNEYDTIQSILKLIEAGKLDTEVVLNIKRNVENAELGDEKLVEIAQGYTEIDEIGQKFTEDLVNARKEMENVGDSGSKSAEEIAEGWNISTERVQNDFAKTEEELTKNINNLEKEQDGLKEKFGETYKDTEEYRKLEVEITRKKEQLSYLQNLKGELLKIAKKPFSIWIDIKTTISDTVKGLLKNVMSEETYKKIFGDEKKPKNVSETAQDEGAEAQARINEKNKKGEEKKTGAQWKSEETKALRARKKELESLLKTELTQADADKYQKELDQINNALKKGDAAAKKLMEQRAKRIADELRYQEELADLQEKAEDARSAAKIAAIENDGERERAERKAQHEKRLREISEEEEEIFKKIYQQRKSAYESQNKGKYENTEAGAAGWEAIMKADKKGEANLTQKEAALVKAVRDRMAAETEKENSDETRRLEALQEKRLQSLRNFLKEYGTIEQQKLAITEEYEEKIRNAQTPEEVASLMLKRDESNEKLSNQNILDSIDWDGVFNDLRGHSVDFLEGLRNQLQSLLSSGEITDLTQLETIQGKIREINSAINEQGGMFQFANEQQREHVRRVQEATDAQKALNVAKQEEVRASMEVFAATKSIQDYLASQGKDANMDLNGDLSTVFDENSDEAKKLAEMLARLKKAQAEYNKAGDNSKKKLFEWQKAEDAAKESLKDSIARVAGNINDWCQQYLGDLPALLDELGLGSAGEKVSQGLSAVNNAAGAAADYASGNFVGAALKAVSAVKDFGRVLGIGSGNAAKVQKTLEELSHKNELLTEAIQTLTDTIGSSAGVKAVAAADEALALQNQKEENIRGKIEAQMGYHRAHGSFNRYWQGFSSAELQKINKTLKTINSEAEEWTGDFANLTADQAKALLANADLVQKIEETGEGGYGERVLEYIRELAAESGNAEEITRQINENLTQTSFDSLRSSFLDTLTDMESDSEDFANSFMEMMFKAMVNKYVLDDEFDAWLKGWQEEYGKAMRENDTDALARLRKEAQDMRDSLAEERDVLADSMGYDKAYHKDQTTTSSAEKITYDQAELLIGILTATQIAVEHGNNDRALILENLYSMNEATRSNGSVVTGIRNLLLTTNGYLYDIKTANETMLDEFGVKMDRIINQLEEMQ